MVDLQHVSGLPLSLDDETGDLTLGEMLDIEEEVSVSIKDLLPVLLNKSIRYPEHVYRQFKGVQVRSTKGKVSDVISYDVLQIPYGLLGIEFVKTHIYYSNYKKNKYDSIIEVIKGTVTMIVQKEQQDEYDDFFEDEPVQIEIIELSEGDRMAVPTGVYYTFINTSSEGVVLSKLSAKGAKPMDYTALQRTRGLAFFIISKNARIEIVSNPKYRSVCEACTKPWKEIGEKDRVQYVNELINDKTPLYNVFESKVNDLEMLLC